MTKKNDLIITLIGKVNAGKTSLFFRLLDIDACREKISPVAGWTEEIELLPIYKDTFLADTPGLDDIETAVSDKTLDFIGDTDIYAHVINAAEGVTATVKECSTELFKTGRPVITIINKMDAFSDENELNEFKNDVFNKLPHAKNSQRLYFTCANSGHGIELLKDGILAILINSEKMLKLARFFRKNRPEIENALREQAHSFVKYAAIRALAISASPVPFSETLPLMMNQYYMIIKIAGVYGENMTYKNIKAVMGSSGAAIAGTSLASTFFYGVKSAVAVSVTYALGMAMSAWIASGKTIPLVKVKEMFNKYKKECNIQDRNIDMRNSAEYSLYSQEAETYSKSKPLIE